MKYPNGIKKSLKKQISHSNRGINLESDINDTNNYYLINNIGIIHKKPVSLTLRKVDYPSRDKAVVKEAYFKTASTTDYNGIYKGKYIDFEAKETNLASFPLNNIHNHQLLHLKNIDNHGGIGFVIVRFNMFNEVYFIDVKKIIEFKENNLRKSIPVDYFRKEAHLINIKFNPRIDYLEIIENFYLKGECL